MPKEPKWVGEQGCHHYKGVKSVTGKVCCGGVYREKVKLNCAIHKHIYAEACNRRSCKYYERNPNA